MKHFARSIMKADKKGATARTIAALYPSKRKPSAPKA
jgi:hypothetical protein